MVTPNDVFNQWWYWPLYGITLFVILGPRKLKPWNWKHDRWLRERDNRPYMPTRIEQREAELQAAYVGDITGNSTDPFIMQIEHERLVEAGCLDPGEPTPWSHYRWVKERTKDFTPEERMMIRSVLWDDE